MPTYDITKYGMPPNIISYEFQRANEKLEDYEFMLIDARQEKDKLKERRAKAGIRLWSVYVKQLADYEALLDIPF